MLTHVKRATEDVLHQFSIKACPHLIFVDANNGRPFREGDTFVNVLGCVTIKKIRVNILANSVFMIYEKNGQEKETKAFTFGTHPAFPDKLIATWNT